MWDSKSVQNSTRIVRWYLHMGSRFERDVIFHVNLEWIPFDHQVALGGGRRDVDKCICHWPTPIVDVWLITPQRSRWFLVNTLALLELPACSAKHVLQPCSPRHYYDEDYLYFAIADIWSMVRVLSYNKKLKELTDYSSNIEMIPVEYIGVAVATSCI